jgi:Holliday junction resolvase RusA-like endonuclease
MPNTQTQTLTIPARMPGMNELVKAGKQLGARAGAKGKRFSGYAKMKSQWSDAIHLLVQSQRIEPVTRVRFVFHWIEPDRKRDLDNIAAGGRKIILDALVSSGVLPNDGWKNVVGFEDRFTVDRSSTGSVRVDIIEIGDDRN